MPDLVDVTDAPPPRVATTDEAETAEEAAGAPDAEKSKSACLPVEMKKRVENAMARLTNFFLNCSLFDILFFAPRIFCEIWLNFDRTLLRMFVLLFGPLLALLLVIDNIVVVPDDNDDDDVGIQAPCVMGGMKDAAALLLTDDAPSLLLFSDTDRASAVVARAMAAAIIANWVCREVIVFVIFIGLIVRFVSLPAPRRPVLYVRFISLLIA